MTYTCTLIRVTVKSPSTIRACTRVILVLSLWALKMIRPHFKVGKDKDVKMYDIPVEVVDIRLRKFLEDLKADYAK